MKLIFFIGLGFFCFNQVILTSADEIESENIPEDIFESNELSSRMDSKTHLIDLNDDCQLLILKQLDFISLLLLSETNDQFKSLVSVILEQMFRKKLIDIVLSIPSYLEIDEDYIKIRNVAMAQQLLNNFGHLIQKLKIRRAYPNTDDATRSIYKLVNSHCSKTLREITLEKSMNNFLDEFTNQFETVEEVFIDNVLVTDRRLNEVFPSMRRLHFRIFKISNTNLINVKYENLEHLKLSINTNGCPFTDNLSAELIRKNSHLRSLTLTHASPKLIKIAADSLPQLERLELEGVRREHSIEPTTFENVKIFKIKECVNSLFLNIKFGNVEELHTDALAESMFGETGFFARNTKLKKLQLAKKYYNIHLNTDVFKQLSHANSTLEDIFIRRVDSVEIETILQLIENNKQLDKLQIIFSKINERESTSEALSREIDDKWSMEAFADTIILKKTHILF